MSVAGNLRIENPCPFVPTRWNKKGNGHYCKSCKKTIIDFRGKTSAEIRAANEAYTCGIFTLDQLPGQVKMQPMRKVLFYGLAVLSFVGFSVKPMEAQTPKHKSGMVLIQQSGDTKCDDSGKQNKKKSKAYKRSQSIWPWRRRLQGCYTF